MLREDGVIFISIDDHEVDNLMKICNEIFGKDMYMACFPRITKKAGKTSDAIAKNHDYILAYSKGSHPALYLPSHTDEVLSIPMLLSMNGGKYKLNQTLDYDSLQYSASLDYPIIIDGETFYPGQSYEKYVEAERTENMQEPTGRGDGVRIYLNLVIKMVLSLSKNIRIIRVFIRKPMRTVKLLKKDQRLKSSILSGHAPFQHWNLWEMNILMTIQKRI